MPTCPLTRQRCGGCTALGTPYQDQLAEKQRHAQALLGRYAPVKPILRMDAPWNYRNKAIATFAMRRGKLTAGLYAAGSHRVLPLPPEGCLLQAEILNRTVAAVVEAARLCRYTAFDEDHRTGLLRHMVLRCSRAGQVLVTVVTAQPELPGSRNFTAALRRAAPWVAGIVHNVNPTASSAVLGNREKVLYGPGFLLDELCGLQFALSSRSFYQVNPVQTEKLYAAALELAGLTGRGTVVDAYCGIGTISLCAASRAARVVGVEVNPAAVRDAAANARRNGVTNARFLCADATRWMTENAVSLRPDVVFLDPPRAGSTPDCIAAVARMIPRRVVYVSCEPRTLARDVALFHQHGYRAEEFRPVDMFPHTDALETVCLLTRRGGAAR